MRAVEPLTYVLVLNDRHNCSGIENLKPDQECDVLVVPANDPKAEPVHAIGRRSQDGEDFTYTTPDGDSVSWNFEFLTRSTIPNFKPAQ
jgi:hypothetical protein